MENIYNFYDCEVMCKKDALRPAKKSLYKNYHHRIVAKSIPLASIRDRNSD